MFPRGGGPEESLPLVHLQAKVFTYPVKYCNIQTTTRLLAPNIVQTCMHPTDFNDPQNHRPPNGGAGGNVLP